jgi:hypothetical protein
MSDFLLTIGFWVSKVDTSLFFLTMNHDICYLFVYVDDILLTGNNSALIQRLITLLSSKFKLRDLGNAIIFWGLRSLLLVWDSCWVSTSMFLIFSVVLVCPLVNLLIHQPLSLRLPCSLVCYFQIPLAFEKLLMLFSISCLLDQRSAML